MRSRSSLLLLTLSLVIFLAMGVGSSKAQGSLSSSQPPSTSTDVVESPKAESKRERQEDFAFLNSYTAIPKSEHPHFLRGLTQFDKSGSLADAATFRPFAHWRHWANERQPFRFAFPLFFLVTFLAWKICPKRLGRAEAECAKKYWVSLGTGYVVSIIALTVVRFALHTEIGWPLGIFLTGLYQLVLLIGGAIVSSMIGKSAFHYAKLNKSTWILQHPNWSDTLQWLVGSLFLALLLQLGSPFALPRLGTRLVTVIALAGIGALYRTRETLISN